MYIIYYNLYQHPSYDMPSKHAGFDLHPIQTGSEALARSGLDDSFNQLTSEPDPFGQNLMQSARTRSDPGQLWKNTTKSKSGKLVVVQW